MDDKSNITKGFNAAYILQKYKPDLAQKIQQGLQDKEHPFAQGFEQGLKQYNKDISHNLLLDFDKRIKERDESPTHNRDHGLDR